MGWKKHIHTKIQGLLRSSYKILNSMLLVFQLIIAYSVLLDGVSFSQDSLSVESPSKPVIRFRAKSSRQKTEMAFLTRSMSIPIVSES